MVNLLLHAISWAEPGEIDPSGLRGQRLVVARQAVLSAYASCFDAPPEPFGRADLVEHHQIISRLAAQMDGILPARFPTWLADEDALRGELGRRQADLIDALERVRGRAEVAVTAVWLAADEPVPPEATTPGRTYLLRRQQALTGTDSRRERAKALADQTERLVGDDLVDVRHQMCPSLTVALSSALLVPREHADRIKTRLAGRAEQDVRILVNGPWPPYTFATVV